MPEILSLYFKKQKNKGSGDVLINYFKNKTMDPQDPFKLLQKQNTGDPRDSNKVLQKQYIERSPRFFQNT